MCTGFWSVEVVPSPKSQLQAVGEPVLVSVNETVRGAFPEATLLVKSATGTTGSVDWRTVIVPSLEAAPSALLTVSVVV